MNTYTKKIKLKEIINVCKGELSINQFVDKCSINPVMFKEMLNTKNDTFYINKLMIDKIITNADNEIPQNELNNIKNSLFHLGGIEDVLEIYRGQIYWIDFGQDNIIGSEQKDIRPALVIQNNVGNKYSPTIIVVAITSKLTKKDIPTHVLINQLEHYCGLERDSIVLAEQIKTIDKSRIKNYIGECPVRLMEKIESALKTSLGLNNPINIVEFTEYFANKFKLKDKFKIAIASEMKKYFEENNIGYMGVDSYIYNLRNQINLIPENSIKEHNMFKKVVCA